MFKFEGILTAMATPMNEDESINETELRNQVNRQIDAGIHGLFCLGTNGEFYCLTNDEKIRILRIVVDEVDGRVPVVGGVGCISTLDTIKLAQEIEKYSVNALSVIVPYFVELSQEQLYSHYISVAEAVSLPIFIYNIPMRTGNNIEIETVNRLAQHPNIVGIKDSSGDIENVKNLIKTSNSDFHVFVGTDSLILQTLLAGGNGAVAGCGNLFPGLIAGIYDAWKSGDFEKAEKYQQKVLPIRSAFKMGNPNSIVKRTMNLLGYTVGPARSPANIETQEVDELITDIISTYSLSQYA
jgi:4-hydroxy-tetrahydrodipicolinate synthase